MDYKPEELPKVIEGLAYEMRFAKTLTERMTISIKELQEKYAEAYMDQAKSEYYRGMLVAFGSVRLDYQAHFDKTKAHFEEVTSAAVQN